MKRFGVIELVASVSVLCAVSASAQPLGTFRWQQQPYCNVFTVRVVQTGGVFQLDGVDDQCGGATQASVVGLAFQNPDGSIGLGLTIVTTPGGTPLHVDATVSLPGASGTWRDNAGNTGPFVLTPGAAVPGTARPVPRAAFPGGLSAGGTSISNVGAPAVASDAANKGYVDAATQSVRTAMLGEKVWKVLVASNGTKQGTGPYTSSRSGVGIYDVTIDITGLGLPEAFPFVVVTPFASSSRSAVVSGISISPGSNMIGFSVRTFDAAGAAVDIGFFALASLPDANTGSLVPPLESLAREGRVTCTTIGGSTTCTFTPE